MDSFKESLLDEYVKNECILQKLFSDIEALKRETYKKIKLTQDPGEKKLLLDNFQRRLHIIQEDKQMEEKYKLLKIRQQDIKTILCKKEEEKNTYEHEDFLSLQDLFHIRQNTTSLLKKYETYKKSEKKRDKE